MAKHQKKRARKPSGPGAKKHPASAAAKTAAATATHPALQPWLIALVLGAYAVMLAFVTAHHEPWADEAQSWLLVRDSSLYDLLFTHLRYEGHPGLWHLVLWLPAQFLPFLPTIQIISFVFACAGVFVFLRYAPFPLPLKLMLPFTFFIFYQYAVVARSYVLLPLLVFGIAALYPCKTRRIYAFTLLCGLLAYTSVYSSAIAITAMFVHLLDLRKQWQTLTAEVRRRQVIAFAVFGALLLLMAVQLWPPADVLHAPYRFPITEYPERFFGTFKDASAAWLFEHKEYQWVAYPVLALSCFWLFKNRVLMLFALPFAVMLFLFATTQYLPWHQGIVFLAWLLALWIAFEKSRGINTAAVKARQTVFLRRAMALAMACVFAVNIYWAAANSILDYQGSYSGGQAAANYIKENGLADAKIVALNYWAVSVLPYFNRNIFMERNDGSRQSFWIWDKENPVFDPDLTALAVASRERRARTVTFQKPVIAERRPELVIVSNPIHPNMVIPGYRADAYFETNVYWKGEGIGNHHLLMYRREQNR